MKQKIFNDGFVEPKAEEITKAVDAGYIIGALRGVKGAIINEPGDWLPFFPIPEDQKKGFETNACATFHTLNPIEALLEYKFGKKENYADRALAIASGTDPAVGNDPHKVAETVRKELGCLPESDLPFSEEIKTVSEFYSPNPLPESIYAKGKQWLSEWIFGHEWVFQKGDDVSYKHSMLKEALKRGTVSVSVRAWMHDGQNYYKPKGSPDTHWCQLLKFEGNTPIIGDSYAPYIKRLSPDYDFGFAKVYYLDENKELDILSKIVDALSKLVPLLSLWVKYTIKEINNPPIPTPEVIDEMVEQDKTEDFQKQWGTVSAARHSVRVICDEEGLSFPNKNIISAVIEAESRFNIKAKNSSNKNGTTDWGICQFNDGKNRQGVPYWIGPGADFVSSEEVLSNPDKCVRVMIREFKKGNLKWWSAYNNGSYKKYL